MAKHRKPGKPSTIYRYTLPSLNVMLLRLHSITFGYDIRGRVGSGK